jgi:hypothetical protein
MPKHLTGPSPSQKIRYADGPRRIPLNKRKRLARHLKKQPNDLQSKLVLDRLGGKYDKPR